MGYDEGTTMNTAIAESAPARSNFVTVVAWIFIVLGGLATFIAVLENVVVHTLFPFEQMRKMAAEQPIWAGSTEPLKSEARQYHSIGVRKGEADTAFGKKLSEIVIDWHRTGYLKELNKKWGVQANEYLEDAAKKYAR